MLFLFGAIKLLQCLETVLIPHILKDLPLLIIGIFLIQVFINVGMNIGIAPIAGVPLPLLSYGGSSIIIMLASLGILQSIYIRRIKTLD